MSINNVYTHTTVLSIPGHFYKWSLQHLCVLQFELQLRAVTPVWKQGSRLGRAMVKKSLYLLFQKGKFLEAEDPLELALLGIHGRVHEAVSSYSHLGKKRSAATSHSILNICKQMLHQQDTSLLLPVLCLMLSLSLFPEVLLQ